MKSILSGTILLTLALSAGAQDKPRVFVQGKGSEDSQSSGSGASSKHFGVWGSKSTVDSHDESMEVTKDLQKNCSGVTITLNQTNADYTVMLNRESKKNRGLLRTNSQVQVANKIGDVLGTNATHTVGNAAKDACELILADWQSHSREDAPAPGTAALAPAVAHPQPAGQPAQPAPQVTPASYQPQPAAAPSQDEAAPADSSDPNPSVGDAARKAKQHQACLQLAKDNPSVVCK
jgi:hypothetical protein